MSKKVHYTILTFYSACEKIINFFDDYSSIVSEAKYKSKSM